MVRVHAFTFNPFMENTYVLSDESGECIIIDPGCYEKGEQEALTSALEKEECQPVRLINTHCHIDHVLGNKFVADHYGLSLEMHELDVPLLHSVADYAPMYGFRYDPSPEPASFLKEGDKVTFGNSELEVLHVPGHAPGHIVLLCRDQEFIIGGDVLFRGGIGRTDLPGGEHNTLIRGIKEKLLPIGDAWTVYPGHGEPTTLGEEKAHNPFLE